MEAITRSANADNTVPIYPIAVQDRLRPGYQASRWRPDATFPNTLSVLGALAQRLRLPPTLANLEKLSPAIPAGNRHFTGSVSRYLAEISYSLFVRRK
jgi:hypothetical protein